MPSAGSAEALRAHLFTHLDGLVVLPTLAALQHRGVHVHLQDQGEVDVDELAGRFEGNAGCFNVALRPRCVTLRDGRRPFVAPPACCIV